MILAKLKQSIFVKNFLIYGLGLVVSGLISFLTIPLILKYYGVKNYGVFSLVQNIILISISFGGGWLNQCVIRFNDNSTTFKHKILVLFYFSFAALLICDLMIVNMMGYGIVASLLLAFTTFTGGLVALYVTFRQSKFQAVTTLTTNIIRVVTYVVFVFLLPKNLYSLIISFFLSYLFSMLFVLKKEWRISVLAARFAIKNAFSRTKVKEVVFQNKFFLNYGLPLAMWFTISSILAVSDRYIIKFYYDDQAVGVYSAVQDMISKGITMICSPILIAGYPLIAKSYNSDNEAKALLMVKKLMFLEAGILAVALVFAVLFKSYFIGSILKLPLLPETVSLVMPITIGVFLWQFAMLAHKPLELSQKTGKMFTGVVLALLTNIIMNMLLLKTMGYGFAAYSAIVSSLVYLIFVYFSNYNNKISS